MGHPLRVTLHVTNGRPRDASDARGFELELTIPASHEDDAWAVTRECMHGLLAVQKDALGER